MRTAVSEIFMGLAAFIMLLMSAVPHHHHCSGIESLRHGDYICFASQEHEADESGCHGMETESGHDRHESDACLLHSIVTLLERVQNVPSYHPALEAVIPQIILVDMSGNHVVDRFIVPFSERLVSSCIVRSSGLRAPPSFV